LTVTVPVAAPGVTIAVKVTLAPSVGEAVELARVVVVAAVDTVTETPLLALVA
jgi:hypothetical protein